MDTRDQLETLFQKQLYDWEDQPNPENWAYLSTCLDKKEKRLSLYSIRRIAAVACLLLLLGSTLLFGPFFRKPIPDSYSYSLQPFACDSCLPVTEIIQLASSHVSLSLPMEKRGQDMYQETIKDTIYLIKNNLNTYISSKITIPELNIPPTLEKRSLPSQTATPAARKWRLGMGGGNFNLIGIPTGNGTYLDQTFNDFAPDPGERPETKTRETQRDRSSLLSEYTPDKVKHSCPISFGIGVSHLLTERWSFNTGISYSFLKNRWKYENSRHDVVQQKLHMIGIPVSFSYRLANWEKLSCYWSVGLTCEFNLHSKWITADQIQRERIRGALWLANTHVGMAYPIIRYVSVYAEGGFLWNLTTDSRIRQVRSEDFFNITGQIGFRLNF